MKVSLPSIILPIAGGLASAFLVTMGTWELLRPAVLPAVSIIAAAVLVRLARGLPFTNPDHFTLEQFRHISANLEANARKLRALIFVCLIVVGLLIIGGSLVALIGTATPQQPMVSTVAARIMSGVIGTLLVFSFARIVEVVHGDVALLKLQSKVLEAAITSKNATMFADAISKEIPPGISGSGKFGTKLPN